MSSRHSCHRWVTDCLYENSAATPTSTKERIVDCARLTQLPHNAVWRNSRTTQSDATPAQRSLTQLPHNAVWRNSRTTLSDATHRQSHLRTHSECRLCPSFVPHNTVWLNCRTTKSDSTAAQHSLTQLPHNKVWLNFRTVWLYDAHHSQTHKLREWESERLKEWVCIVRSCSEWVSEWVRERVVNERVYKP
jgi:hypothetical protein